MTYALNNRGAVDLKNLPPSLLKTMRLFIIRLIGYIIDSLNGLLVFRRIFYGCVCDCHPYGYRNCGECNLKHR